MHPFLRWAAFLLPFGLLAGGPQAAGPGGQGGGGSGGGGVGGAGGDGGEGGSALGLGAPCTTDASCASGACVDATCCDGTCNGLCESCSGADTGLADGTCGAVTAGEDPVDECAGMDTCGVESACGCADGAKNGGETGIDCGGPACAACPLGQGCATTADCTDGFCDATQSCGRPRSCKDLLDMGVTVSGLYDVYPDGTAAAVNVYCDQEIAGGGSVDEGEQHACRVRDDRLSASSDDVGSTAPVYCRREGRRSPSVNPRAGIRPERLRGRGAHQRASCPSRRAPGTFTIFLGATPGEELSFFLRRIYMPEGEPVEIVSRNPSRVTLVEPDGGFATDASTPVRIRVHGTVSGDHEDVGLAVVWHGKTIHEMVVRVFRKLTIRLACHRVGVGVRYRGELFASLPTCPEFAALRRGLGKYWARAGIDFALEDGYHDVQVEGPYQGALRVIAPYGELNAAISRSFAPGKLNLYFAAILADGGGEQLPDRLGQYVPAAQRCIVVKAGGAGEGLFSTVAHEVGHYLDLRHPYESTDYGEHDTPPPAGRWFLMHLDASSRYLMPLKWVTSDGPHRLNENGAETARTAVTRYGLTG